VTSAEGASAHRIQRQIGQRCMHAPMIELGRLFKVVRNARQGGSFELMSVNLLKESELNLVFLCSF